MKKIVFIFIGIITLLAIPVTVFLAMRNQELRKKAAPATSLTLSPATVSKKVGDEFTIEAKIDTADNQIISAEINLVFDPTKLEAISITNGPKLPNIASSGVIGSGTASITVGAPNTTTPVTGVGTAAIIKFKALAATTSPTSIRFSQDSYVGALGESTNVLVSSSPSTITITEGSGTSTLTTPTPTPTLAPDDDASKSASTSSLQITSPLSNEALGTTQPTITGNAAPNATVTITIYSEPKTVTVVADASGNWTYSVPDPLESGPHTIVVAAIDPSTNVTKTATLAFVVSDGTTESESVMPVSGVIENTLFLISLGVLFIFIGIVIPTLSFIKL